VRATAGTLVALAGLLFDSPWGVLALFPLLSATLAWCPLYQLLGRQPGGGDPSCETDSRGATPPGAPSERSPSQDCSDEE